MVLACVWRLTVLLDAAAPINISKKGSTLIPTMIVNILTKSKVCTLIWHYILRE